LAAETATATASRSRRDTVERPNITAIEPQVPPPDLRLDTVNPEDVSDPAAPCSDEVLVNGIGNFADVGHGTLLSGSGL